MQIEWEILELVRAVAEIEPKVVLEIGTAAGGTTFLWAQLAREEVLTCDLRAKRPLREMLPLFPRPGSSCRMQYLHGDSHSRSFQEEVKSALGGRPVDFLFIDGDHTEPGVEADYRSFSPLVRPGGLIAFHDIARRQPLATNQVQDFWSRLKREAPHFREFIRNPEQCGYGIGLIVRQ